ncbi:MAG: hypothetical protein BWY64_03478 [bacterium ADurb.Bin363]|nr:MAG: hypothetical protein BWY64_03478 [bacterium ADurb.Bin363]
MNPKCLGCGKVIVIEKGKTVYRCDCRTVNTVQAMKDMRKLREYKGKKKV